MTERAIQDVLYAWCKEKRHRMTIPNCKATGHEADLLSLTKSTLLHEFEIKTNRSDYFAEFEKEAKHNRLLSIHKGFDPDKPCANYFWFAFPPNLVDPGMVPEYAGIIEVNGSLSVKREAPRLHSEKPSDRLVRYIQRGISARFWKLRRGDF